MSVSRNPNHPPLPLHGDTVEASFSSSLGLQLIKEEEDEVEEEYEEQDDERLELSGEGGRLFRTL